MPVADEFKTPRQAVESIAHNSEQLARFLWACRDSFAASRDLVKWANDQKKELGEKFDPGPLAKAIELTDKNFVTLVLDDIDQSSYLHGLCAVRLWTTLEAGVNDLVLSLMNLDDRWKLLAVFQKIKVPAGEFVAMSPRDQMKHLMDTYMTAHGVRQKAGVGRFEDILNPVGLGGPVDNYVAKAILELGEVRHVLVHRGGFVDAKFEDRCPWVPKYGAGVLRVTPGFFLVYFFAVMTYMAELMARLQQNGWLEGSQNDDWASIRDNGVKNLRANMDSPPRPSPGSMQDWWDDLLIWKDGTAPPNPFAPQPEAPEHQQEPRTSEEGPDTAPPSQAT
jgi:hypothetical protein